MTSLHPPSFHRNDFSTCINGERTVSFPTGATEACVAFDIIDDILQENDEIFTVTFSLRPGIMTGVHATATVTIIDNDGG